MVLSGFALTMDVFRRASSRNRYGIVLWFAVGAKEHVMNESWRITLLGGLRAQQGAQVLITRFRTQKVASLFAYLAYYLRQAHSREILVEMLWPESDVPT